MHANQIGFTGRKLTESFFVVSYAKAIQTAAIARFNRLYHQIMTLHRPQPNASSLVITQAPMSPFFIFRTVSDYTKQTRPLSLFNNMVVPGDCAPSPIGYVIVTNMVRKGLGSKSIDNFGLRLRRAIFSSRYSQVISLSVSWHLYLKVLRRPHGKAHGAAKALSLPCMAAGNGDCGCTMPGHGTVQRIIFRAPTKDPAAIIDSYQRRGQHAPNRESRLSRGTISALTVRQAVTRPATPLFSTETFLRSIKPHTSLRQLIQKEDRVELTWRRSQTTLDNGDSIGGLGTLATATRIHQSMDCTPVTAPSVRFVSATRRFASRRPIKSVFTDEKECKASHCLLIGLPGKGSCCELLQKNVTLSNFRSHDGGLDNRDTAKAQVQPGDSLGRLLSELTRSYYGFDTRGQPPSPTRHSDTERNATWKMCYMLPNLADIGRLCLDSSVAIDKWCWSSLSLTVENFARVKLLLGAAASPINAQAQGIILGKEFNCTPPTTPTDSQRPKVRTLMVFMQMQIARNRKTITILLHATSLYIFNFETIPGGPNFPRITQDSTNQAGTVYCLIELSATAGVRPSHAINLLFNSNPETLSEHVERHFELVTCAFFTCVHATTVRLRELSQEQRGWRMSASRCPQPTEDTGPWNMKAFLFLFPLFWLPPRVKNQARGLSDGTVPVDPRGV
ncbi:uncharacterized protein CLUP02_05737 [Colletotrichum lupini]|uniref:Uncharacterized protein n=1 Tax=Colletotrichum lupini TaxID=145971 RepID=A0A9Q8WF18_9PEZI|nr:uncharacterized protein CLUP02_05737 [Colletotrichum lupini]UQC80255.1 hypothetical protein CLUP02_05737 [Colletotrichum lupini]